MVDLRDARGALDLVAMEREEMMRQLRGRAPQEPRGPRVPVRHRVGRALVAAGVALGTGL